MRNITVVNYIENIQHFFSKAYVNKIIGEQKCEFQCNVSTTDQIFSIWGIKYNGELHELFVDIKKSCNVVREIIHIFIQFNP